MAVVDADGDGIPDTFDTLERIALMEGARMLEALMSRRRAMADMAHWENQHIREQAENRLKAEAVQSRYRLEPVLSDSWWARADLETIGRRYAEAKSWDGVDPSFLPFVERIEERAKALHDLEPEHIMDEVRARDMVPFTLDEARAVAAQTAPQWYRLHDRLASGELVGTARSDTEDRLVADMTHLRDSGRLDTDSAKMEWAEFLDHKPAVRALDVESGEDVGTWMAERTAAAAELWDRTAQDRASLNIPPHPDGVLVARPMSVPEARAFAKEFAPEWFQFGHEQNRNGVFEHDREFWDNQRHVDDQMRYAMEQLRDTGTMAHPYAAMMREALAGHPEVDVTEGPGEVTREHRMRFGGSPHARPLTDGEALELMNDYAPEWYRKPTLAALSPDSILSPEQRAGQLDAIRADMTRLRDKGILDTDNAKMVWAAQNPDVAADGYDWGLPARPTEVWVKTADTRPGPAVVPSDVRERVGGVVAPSDPSEAVPGRSTPLRQPVSGDSLSESRWDSVKRRRQEAKELRDNGASPAAVKAYLVSDTMSGKDPAAVDPNAVSPKARKPKRRMGQSQHRKM